MGANTPYATRRARPDEIEDVLYDHRSRFERNHAPGRAASHMATGRTRDNRPLKVFFIYRDGTATPINAMEGR